MSLDRIPELTQALLIRVSVLYDHSQDSVGVEKSEPVTNGSSIIHDVDGELLNTEFLDEFVDDVREVLERVCEVFAVGSTALAIARVVGRY